MIKGEKEQYFHWCRGDVLDRVPKSAKRVLSVGCGAGLTESKLVDRGVDVVGIEISKEAAEEARTNGLEVLVGNVENFDETCLGSDFDCIIYADILEHLTDPERVLQRHCRLLNDRGRVIISVPNFRNFQVFKQLFLAGHFQYEDAGIFDFTHLRITTRKMVVNWLRRTGLDVSEVQYGTGGAWKRRILRATPILGKEFLARQVLLVAEKQNTTTSATPQSYSSPRKLVSVIGFGDPLDNRTFSGYARNLTLALRERGALKSTYSAKQVKFGDALSGALSLNYGARLVSKPKISREWMWGTKGNGKLQQRLCRSITQNFDSGPFLQIGTLVEVPRAIGRHFVVTDMTIPQAKREGFFDISKLSGKALAQSLEIQAKVFSNAEKIFVLSDWTKQSVLEDFGVPESKVTTIYAGSNLVLDDSACAERNPYEILFVGIDWERKGGPLLLKAFELLKEQVPGATLTIVGCSPDVSIPGVNVVGYLNKAIPEQRKILSECFLRAACFCLPTYFDPFPNVIIEAASVGLPSVAIDTGSRREAIKDGITGRLSLDRSPDALATALHWVVSDTERSYQLGQNAKNHASQFFTWSKVVEKIVESI